MHRHVVRLGFLALAIMTASILGGEATAERLAAPTITSISPASGPRGTAVTITGMNLQGATLTWKVAGNNGGSAPGTISGSVSPDGTTIMFSVPDGGSSSNGIMSASGANRVTVTTPEGSVSKLFSVTTTNKLGMRPALTYLTPRSAARGAQITIFGTHLATTTAVKLGGLKAKFHTPSDTRIIVTVPLAAHSGHWRVTTDFGTAVSSAFTVKAAAN